MEDDILIVNAVAMQTSVTGDYVYRVEQPSIAMGKIPGVTVITVSTVSPYFEDLCLQADVLVLHLLTEHDLLPIVEERKRGKLTTVYEISDNFAADQPGVGIRGWFRDPVNRAQAFQHITMSDAVQVTGEGLLEKFQFLNSSMVVFENQICEMGMIKEQQRQVVIGWGGSSGHAEDLRQVSQTIAYICNRYPDVVFSFMGDRELYDEIFSSLSGNQKTYTTPGTLTDYYGFLETLDIGIAVMGQTPYNQCRSDIKFVEYASRGAVPVLSAITPYRKHAVHKANALLFEDNNQLEEILDDLVRDPELRRTVSHNAYEYVNTHRMEGPYAWHRVNFYKSLSRKNTVKDFRKLTLTRLCSGSEAYDVGKTRAESLLCKGVGEEARGNIDGARSLYRNAHEEMPGYYLPLFWLGYSHMRHQAVDEAIKYLDSAIANNPRSVRALLYLGNLLEPLEKAKALGRYEAALSVSRSYAPCIEAIALLCEGVEDYPNAVKFYNNALEVNPFYSNAALGLGRVYEALGEREKSNEAFLVAADMSVS
ncbi:MAG: tetratricopeptide repeat protein [Planctomycetes bacterium]|nr:tetratricopeptide repeat protein [Planctomycetota bacterium]